LRKRKQSVTHELNERERTLQKRAIVGRFIDTNRGLLGGLMARTAARRAAPSGSQCRVSYVSNQHHTADYHVSKAKYA
jgi:hypothetical protein